MATPCKPTLVQVPAPSFVCGAPYMVLVCASVSSEWPRPRARRARMRSDGDTLRPRPKHACRKKDKARGGRGRSSTVANNKSVPESENSTCLVLLVRACAHVGCCCSTEYAIATIYSRVLLLQYSVLPVHFDIYIMF